MSAILPDPTVEASTLQLHHRSLRRPQSLSCLSPGSDSSEICSEDSGSVYDTDIVQSLEDLVPLEGDVLPGLSHNREGVTLPTKQPPAVSCSGWRPTTLGPIPEKRSTLSLKRSSSVPYIRSSIERHPTIRQSQNSICSMRGIVKTPSFDGHQNTILEDQPPSPKGLNCLLHSDTKALCSSRSAQMSSTSTEILRAINSHPATPARPRTRPPHRSATPPGLPPFGSLKAMRLRLTPASMYTRIMDRIRQWLHIDVKQVASESDRVVESNRLASSTAIQPASSSLSPVRNLRSILGSTRLVQLSPSSSIPRVSLPPGIATRRHPGPLINADDGTWVLGWWWTSQASGHGVGHHDLEDHSLNRATTEEIDKLCMTPTQDSRVGMNYRSFIDDSFGQPCLGTACVRQCEQSQENNRERPGGSDSGHDRVDIHDIQDPCTTVPVIADPEAPKEEEPQQLYATLETLLDVIRISSRNSAEGFHVRSRLGREAKKQINTIDDCWRKVWFVHCRHRRHRPTVADM